MQPMYVWYSRQCTHYTVGLRTSTHSTRLGLAIESKIIEQSGFPTCFFPHRFHSCQMSSIWHFNVAFMISYVCLCAIWLAGCDTMIAYQNVTIFGKNCHYIHRDDAHNRIAAAHLDCTIRKWNFHSDGQYANDDSHANDRHIQMASPQRTEKLFSIRARE